MPKIVDRLPNYDEFVTEIMAKKHNMVRINNIPVFQVPLTHGRHSFVIAFRIPQHSTNYVYGHYYYYYYRISPIMYLTWIRYTVNMVSSMVPDQQVCRGQKPTTAFRVEYLKIVSSYTRVDSKELYTLVPNGIGKFLYGEKNYIRIIFCSSIVYA